MKHNITAYLYNNQHRCAYAILCYLFLYGMQWPILLIWGLPIHPLAGINTALCTPLLFGILMWAAGTFILCIVGYPNHICFSVLEQSIDWWLAILKQPISIHISCICPSWGLLCTIPIATYLITYYIPGIWYKNLTLTIFFITIFSYLHTTSIASRLYSVSATCILKTTHKATILLHVPHKRTKYTHKWVSYTLLPSLRKHTGNTVVDYVITPTHRYSPLHTLLWRQGILRTKRTVSVLQIIAILKLSYTYTHLYFKHGRDFSILQGVRAPSRHLFHAF